MRRIGGWSLFAVLLSLAGPVTAEEAPSSPSRTLVKGRWSLAFTLPAGGGGALGVWRMVSERSNLGVNLGVDHRMEKMTQGPDSLRDESGFGFWEISVGPSLKRYLVVRERVSPFLFGSLEGSYRWSEGIYRRSATLLAGLGADWTPLESISIGAATGISWTESIRNFSASGAPKESLSLFGTMTTSLTMALYF